MSLEPMSYTSEPGILLVYFIILDLSVDAMVSCQYFGVP